MTDTEIVEGLIETITPRLAKLVRECIEEQGSDVLMAHGSDREPGIRIAMAAGRADADYQPVDDILDQIATSSFPLEEVLWRNIEAAPGNLSNVLAGLDAVKAGLQRHYAEVYGKSD